MELELAGKVALVTGSSTGIGLAIARQLHAEGCFVVLNGRDAQRLDDARSQLSGSVAVVADVTQPEQCQELVGQVLAHFDRLDILVCNVGSGRSVPPGQETPQEWRRVMDLNLHAATQMVWAAQESLMKSSGNVVCISSICGLEALGCPLPYAAAKAALESYVKNSARWLGRQGVRINSVVPGNILFSDSVWARKLKEDEQAVQDMLNREVALGCLGSPEDVARITIFLASPMARFITGSSYVVDGGQLRS